jgi:hypothetical protein
LFDTYGCYFLFLNLYFDSLDIIIIIIIVKVLELKARPWDVIILKMKVSVFFIDLYLQNMIFVIITCLHDG